VPADVSVRGIRRWSVLTVCVAEPYRMSDIDATAVFVLTVMVFPGTTLLFETDVMDGRVAGEPSLFKRYCGV
jgi:hypothetical protein